MNTPKMMPLANAEGGCRFYCRKCGERYATDWVHIVGGLACTSTIACRAKAMLAAAPFIPSWDMAESDKRLMLLAAHLEHADERHAAKGEPLYDQSRAFHDCGTPACAGGHSDAMYANTRLRNASWNELYDIFGTHYFDIFGGGRRRTSKQAATGIRKLVLRYAARMRTVAS